MHPQVDLVVCEGGPDSLEILPRHIHVQAGDVLEPRPDCFPLRQIQPVAGVTPRLIRQAAPGGVPVDPATTLTRADQCGRVAGEAGDVVVNPVNLIQDSIHIRIIFCCPGNVTLQVGYRAGGGVRAAFTGNHTSIRGEDFQSTHMRPDPRPPIISLVDTMIKPEGQAVMPGAP